MSIFAIDLPPVGKAVGGNARGHWRTRHNAFQQAKMTAAAMIRNGMNGHGLYGDVHWSPVKIEVVWFYTNASHRPDRDNLPSRIKPYIDAAVAVGLIPDDTPDHVLGIQYSYQRSSTAGVRLVFHQERKRSAA